MYQVYPSQIGYEYYDPPTFNCPFGSNCRFSDASLYRLNSGVQYDNLIAHPNGEGSLIFDETLTITKKSQPPSGWSIVMKVGRTTGLQGEIIWDDCESKKGSDGVWRMCSIETSLNSSEGDSGSPVFWLTGNENNPDAKLYGIIWGGNSSKSYASNIGLIEAELGLLTITF